MWLWPNLLSLDAPLVALLWQLLFIRCFHASAGSEASQLLPSFLLVSAVWLIYTADRALDAWRGAGMRPRHEFYRRHWRAVLPVWTLVFAATVWLAWTGLPRQLFERGVWLGAAVLVYFAAVHSTHWRWPKEAAVAVIFALGASLAAWTRVETRADVVTVILFPACAGSTASLSRYGNKMPRGSAEPSTFPWALYRPASGWPRSWSCFTTGRFWAERKPPAPRPSCCWIAAG